MEILWIRLCVLAQLEIMYAKKPHGTGVGYYEGKDFA